MVFYKKEKGHWIVAWYDGRIPSKAKLLHETHPNRLRANGFDAELAEKLGLLTPESRRGKNRQDLFLDLIVLSTDKYAVRRSAKERTYQIALFQPKWDRFNRPRIVRWAEDGVHSCVRFFSEDDKLLNSISHEEILHVRPVVWNLSDSQYYQLVAVYPKSGRDWRWVGTTDQRTPGRIYALPGFLEELISKLDISPPDAWSYHNYTIYEEQMRQLLWRLGELHSDGEDISSELSKRGFRIVSSRVSFDKSKA